MKRLLWVLIVLPFLMSGASVTPASAQGCVGGADQFCNTSCAVVFGPANIDTLQNEVVVIAMNGGVCRQWHFPFEGVWDISSIRFDRKGPCGIVGWSGQGVTIDAHRFGNLNATLGMCTEIFQVAVKSRDKNFSYHNSAFNYYFCVATAAQYHDLPKDWPQAVQRYRECSAATTKR